MTPDELLVVGLDLEGRREVHIDEKPMDQWRQLGYRHRESVVCAACFYGLDGVPQGTRVPLVSRGRIGGRRRPHFAHPPHMTPPGGHHPETLWHIEAKLCLQRWAGSLPGVTEVQQEQWIPTRERRADVHVRLADGSLLALEAQSALITDQLWQRRHRDYAAAGIQDVWFMRPGLALPHVLFAEKVPVCVLQLTDRTARVMCGQPHQRIGRWWETQDPTVYALHHPPCPGDDTQEETTALADLGLSASGLVLPESLTRKLADEHRKIRERVDRARTQADEDNQRRHRLAAQAARRLQLPVVSSRRITPLRPRVATGLRTSTPRKPRCAVCAGPLSGALAPYSTHIAVRDGDGWVDCLGRPCMAPGGEEVVVEGGGELDGVSVQEPEGDLAGEHR
ncbi:competence protein CoiA family protein [Streptomyces decoyicus]|uniref:competence protein CoiA family protein n=1 Tax=Streptomyces decoyicus TaxID=249567 RepID=UPI00365957E4